MALKLTQSSTGKSWSSIGAAEEGEQPKVSVPKAGAGQWNSTSGKLTLSRIQTATDIAKPAETAGQNQAPAASLAQLEAARRQAAVDLDTETVERLDRQMKEMRAEAGAPSLLALTKPAVVTVGGSRGGRKKESVVEVPTLLGRAVNTVKGGAKGFLASHMDTVGTLYQSGQEGRTARDAEALAGYRADAARAEQELAELLAADGLDAKTVLAGLPEVGGLGSTARRDYLRNAGVSDPVDVLAVVNMLEDTRRKAGAAEKAMDAQPEAGEAARDLAMAVQQSGSGDIERAKEGLGTLGQIMVDAGASTAQMAGDAAASAVLGMPGSMLPFAGRAFGGGTQAARAEGADLKHQILYGGAMTAKEVFTEKMFNVALPFSKAYGGGALDDAVESAIAQAVERFGRTESGKKLLGGALTFGASVLSEGAEEFIGDWMEWQMPRIYGGEPAGAAETLENALYDFLVGAAAGAIGGAVNPGAYNYELSLPTLEDAGTQTAPGQQLYGDEKAAPEAGTAGKPKITMEDFVNTESSLWNNVEYDDTAAQDSITQTVHQEMVDAGQTVRIPESTTQRTAEAYPDLRTMKKADRIPIMKQKMNTLKASLRQFLDGLKGANFEFEVNGNILEARLYNAGIQEVLSKITQDKASMLLHSDEIFRNAKYLYSTDSYDGNPNIYRWNYFYTPVQIGDQTVGVRIAVRDMAKTQESQIYNWGIKKDVLLGGGGGRKSASHTGASSSTSPGGTASPVSNPTITGPTNFVNTGSALLLQEDGKTKAQPVDASQLHEGAKRGYKPTVQEAAGMASVDTVSQPLPEVNGEKVRKTQNGGLNDGESAGGPVAAGAGGQEGGGRGAQEGPGLPLSDGDAGRGTDGRVAGRAARVPEEVRTKGASGEHRALIDQRRTVAADQPIISAAEAGVPFGTDTKAVRILPETDWDKEIRRGAEWAYARGVREVTVLLGPIEVGNDGRSCKMAGVIDPDAGRVFIQGDHWKQSFSETLEHETAHMMSVREEVQAFMDAVKGRYKESAWGRLFEVYRMRYEDVTDGYAGMSEQQAELYVWEEILADAYADTNKFGTRASVYGAEADAVFAGQLNGTGVQPMESRTAEGPGRGIGEATDRTTGPPRYSYGGRSAREADSAAMEAAERLEMQGMDPENIRQETGWFRGMDGKWRFEIDDSGMEYQRRGDLGFRGRNGEYDRYRQLTEKAEAFMLGQSNQWLTDAEQTELTELQKTWSGTFKRDGRISEDALPMSRLDDYLKHDELFQNYPQLRETGLVFRELPEGINGFYSPEQDVITLSERLRHAPEDTLVHEIQHVIQHAEGFAKGSSPEYWDGDSAKYRNTAGEIEARDAAERRELTAEERRVKLPDLGDENTVFAEGDGQSLSIGYDKDNRPFVTVEEDILDGVPEGRWVKTVKDNLRQKFPKGVTVGRNTIKINDQSRREMTFSKYMQKLMRTDREVYSDKLRATNNAGEILQAAQNWVNEALLHPRKDAIIDFARGDVQLRIGEKDYTAQVIVGNKGGGDLLLYDIIDLKPITIQERIKETGEDYITQPHKGTGNRQSTPVSEDSITQQNAESKGENPERVSLPSLEEPKPRFSVDDAEQGAVERPKTKLEALQKELDQLRDVEYQTELLRKGGAAAIAENEKKVNKLQKQVDKLSGKKSERTKSPSSKPVAQSKPIIAKQDLRKNLLNVFSIPEGQKAELGAVIDGFADRLLREGALTEEDRSAFFDRLYGSGVMTVAADTAFQEGREAVVKGRIYVNDIIKGDFGEDWNDFRKRALGAP